MFIVLVPLLYAAIYRVTPQPSECVGVAVALLGMGLMTLDGTQLSANPGDLLTLVGSFFYALHVIALGHFAPRDGFERLSVLQTTTAAALGLSMCWWVETPFIQWSPTVLLALAVTGLLATAVAFSLQSWAQQHTSPTRTALIFALEPVFAGATSFLLLGEVLSGPALAGAALILIGILLVELKPLGPRNHP
jgi:drug/metabolite transporter (DMT)-like permease